MLGAHDVELGTGAMVALNAAVFGLLLFGIWKVEKGLNSGSDLLVLSLLAVAGIFGRILLEPLPNVSPVTILVLLAGAHFGARRAVALAAVIALFSNLWMGHGLWTFYQAVGWSLVGCAGALLSSWLLDEKRELVLPRLMAVGFAAGFVFDWFVSLSVLHTQPVSYLPPYLAQGFMFDLVHALGNLAFAAVIGVTVSQALERHRTIRLEVAQSVPVTA